MPVRPGTDRWPPSRPPRPAGYGRRVHKVDADPVLAARVNGPSAVAAAAVADRRAVAVGGRGRRDGAHGLLGGRARCFRVARIDLPVDLRTTQG